jgi:hypothetical protein
MLSRKILKICSLARKGAKQRAVAEEIKSIKKKPSPFPRDSRRDVWRVSQVLARSHPLQAQGCKSVDSFQRLH